MKQFIYFSSFIVLSFFFSLTAFSQVPTVSFVSVASGLVNPLDIANAGDGTNRLFIVEKQGTVRILKNNALNARPFLNMIGLVQSGGSEQGLLSIAFHPDYETNRYFYVYYNNSAGNVQLARYRTVAANPDSADANSRVILLTVNKTAGNHNGGKINFGPDGNLYLGIGDGGGTGDPNNLAQKTDTLLGKMIRINVNNFTTPPYYTIPPTNPFAGNVNYRGEIWAVGLRNPWRWSFDKQTGDMWIADVGQSAWEEVNFRAAGATGGINYGWRCYEGNSGYNTAGCAAQNTYVSPIFNYPHNSNTGGFSITGGYVYRGTEFSVFNGYYICADYVSGNGWLIKSNGNNGWDVTLTTTWPDNISSFGEAENGDLYAVTLIGNNSILYKIFAPDPGPLPLKLVSFTAKAGTNAVVLQWMTENEVNTQDFELQQSTDAIAFSKVALVVAKNQSSNTYTYTDNTFNQKVIAYRIKITDKGGRISYSPVIRINNKANNNPVIYPNLIQDQLIHLYPKVPVKKMEVYTVAGKSVMQVQLNSGLGYYRINLPQLSAGTYFVKLYEENNIRTERIIIQ